jgi:hypothetical protein
MEYLTCGKELVTSGSFRTFKQLFKLAVTGHNLPTPRGYSPDYLIPLLQHRLKSGRNATSARVKRADAAGSYKTRYRTLAGRDALSGHCAPDSGRCYNRGVKYLQIRKRSNSWSNMPGSNADTFKMLIRWSTLSCERHFSQARTSFLHSRSTRRTSPAASP